MKTYSSVVVIDWYTDDAIKNSFGYDTAYKLKVKCDAGCPRDICLDKYFVNKEWRKYEECAKWQLRFMKSIENKEKRKNRAIGMGCTFSLVVFSLDVWSKSEISESVCSHSGQHLTFLPHFPSRPFNYVKRAKMHPPPKLRAKDATRMIFHHVHPFTRSATPSQCVRANIRSV